MEGRRHSLKVQMEILELKVRKELEVLGIPSAW